MLQKVISASIAVLLLVSVAHSKAPLSKLFISGGRLSKPIEITDPGILQLSNPWFGSFISQWNEVSERTLTEPPSSTPRYELSFYAAFSPKELPHIVYVAYYAFDPSTQSGFVYLPGHNETVVLHEQRQHSSSPSRWTLESRESGMERQAKFNHLSF